MNIPTFICCGILSLFLLSSCSPQPQVTRIEASIDKDADGIDDFQDIVASARSQIGVTTKYDTSYYTDAFPPEDRGACADVIWRALQGAGYDFKKMIDADIKAHRSAYITTSVSDTNINFRRVVNIQSYLERNAQKLTEEIIPGDMENLAAWQGGDIVTYEQIPGGLWHVAIISDKRRADGVPLLIHNYGSGVKEDDYLQKWPTKISGHYRFIQKSK